MEIVKQNENYSISDKTEKGWIVSGNASSEVNGALSFNISVSSELGENIGNFSYSKWAENDNISVNYTVAEVNRDDLVAYSDTLIDWVLEQFKA